MKISKPVLTVALLTVATTTVFAGISGGGAATTTFEPGNVELLVIGPVEAVNPEAHVATVLGQRVQSLAVSGLAIGSLVAVYGRASLDGSITASAIQARGSYVPGASQVFFSGIVQKASPTIGRAVVNGVSIDLTPAMASGAISPIAGARLKITGIQPVAGGLVLVSGISGGGAGVNGISGGGAGVSGISGGGAGVNGISGGGAGVSGISGGGAGVNGISGGGAGVSG
ncbi:MAG TPA: hypothetical protein VGI91_03795, partial [Steroidobacteraceae bacterium]